jgi:vacuolar-type H+-ATPase subunit F/Vma7
VYVGPTGLGLGFTLAGIRHEPCERPESLLAAMRALKDAGEASIIFVDEALAEPSLTELEALNADPVPAIVLLPSATARLNVTQEKMKRLLVKAVGSDIIGN